MGVDRIGPFALDLAGLEFLDSTGLRMLLRLQMHADTQDALFAIARPSSAAPRLLELTGMQARFSAAAGCRKDS